MKKLIIVVSMLIVSGCTTTSTVTVTSNTPDWEKKWCKPCSSLEDNVTTVIDGFNKFIG